jgi:hypothetical protein
MKPIYFFFYPLHQEDPCDAEFTKIETHIDELKPNYRIDNNGIGSYEFWGQSSYDHGTNYIEEVDYDPMFIKINGLKSPDERKKYAEIIIDNLPNVTIEVNDDFTADYKVIMKNEIDNGHTFTAELQLKETN